MGLAARVVHRQPFFNLIVTNVPGPQVPLYCMGARLLEAFPIVPLTRNLTVVVGDPVVRRHAALRAVGRPRRVRRPRGARRAGIDDAFAETVEDRARSRGQSMTELWERDAWELADAVRAR